MVRRGPRSVAVAGVGLLHAGVLVVLGLGGQVGAAPALPASAITVRAITGAAPAPVARVPLRLQAVATDVAPPAFDIAPAAGGTGSDAGCQLLGAVQSALSSDDGVRRVLAGIPAATSAVMLWDGRWHDDTLGGAAATNPVRQAIVARIAAAAPACRDATMTGPRLLVVASGNTSIALALGSGTWRWAELLS
ncbi:MAG: hypothetical protein ACRYG4_19900 [Janthinobacterium lividum]